MGHRRDWRLKDLRARRLEIALHDQVQLLDVALAAQARQLRSQLEVRGDQALIFAIEEETNLPQRFEIAFVGQLHHVSRI